MVYLMMVNSGAGHRAERRRSALPVRMGDLAGLTQRLMQWSLLEVVKDSFAVEHAGLCWTYFSCCACNSLCGLLGPLPRGGWNAAEVRAKGTVFSMTKRLLKQGQDSSEVDVSSIEKDIKLARVNYAGKRWVFVTNLL